MRLRQPQPLTSRCRADLDASNIYDGAIVCSPTEEIQLDRSRSTVSGDISSLDREMNHRKDLEPDDSRQELCLAGAERVHENESVPETTIIHLQYCIHPTREPVGRLRDSLRVDNLHTDSRDEENVLEDGTKENGVVSSTLRSNLVPRKSLLLPSRQKRRGPKALLAVRIKRYQNLLKQKLFPKNPPRKGSGQVYCDSPNELLLDPNFNYAAPQGPQKVEKFEHSRALQRNQEVERATFNVFKPNGRLPEQAMANSLLEQSRRVDSTTMIQPNNEPYLLPAQVPIVISRDPEIDRAKSKFHGSSRSTTPGKFLDPLNYFATTHSSKKSVSGYSNISEDESVVNDHSYSDEESEYDSDDGSSTSGSTAEDMDGGTIDAIIMFVLSKSCGSGNF